MKKQTIYQTISQIYNSANNGIKKSVTGLGLLVTLCAPAIGCTGPRMPKGTSIPPAPQNDLSTEAGVKLTPKGYVQVSCVKYNGNPAMSAHMRNHADMTAITDLRRYLNKKGIPQDSIITPVIDRSYNGKKQCSKVLGEKSPWSQHEKIPKSKYDSIIENSEKAHGELNKRRKQNNKPRNLEQELEHDTKEMQELLKQNRFANPHQQGKIPRDKYDRILKNSEKAHEELKREIKKHSNPHSSQQKKQRHPGFKFEEEQKGYMASICIKKRSKQKRINKKLVWQFLKREIEDSTEYKNAKNKIESRIMPVLNYRSKGEKICADLFLFKKK